MLVMVKTSYKMITKVFILKYCKSFKSCTKYTSVFWPLVQPKSWRKRDLTWAGQSQYCTYLCSVSPHPNHKVAYGMSVKIYELVHNFGAADTFNAYIGYTLIISGLTNF